MVVIVRETTANLRNMIKDTIAAKRQRTANQIKAVFAFARAHFVNMHGIHKRRNAPVVSSIK
jgi:hypothetical protein